MVIWMRFIENIRNQSQILQCHSIQSVVIQIQIQYFLQWYSIGQQFFDFLINTIESGEITDYYNKSLYPESLYLLAMVDYISRVNGIPLCDSYNEIRKTKLKNVLFPSSVVAAAAVSGDKIKEQALKSSIPEFLKFNIVETDVRNVN